MYLTDLFMLCSHPLPLHKINLAKSQKAGPELEAESWLTAYSLVVCYSLVIFEQERQQKLLHCIKS